MPSRVGAMPARQPPGEPGSETWKGNANAWQTGGGAVTASICERRTPPSSFRFRRRTKLN